MGRADILQSVYDALESHAPLTTLLGHTVGATTVAGGARILGDGSYLTDIPVPSLILGFERGDAVAPEREMKHWQCIATVYAADIFKAADILDEVEAACVDYRFDPLDAQPLNQLQIGAHQRIVPDAGQGRVIITGVNLTAYWI